MTEYLNVTQHKNRTEIDVVQACAIQWSVDQITWASVLSEVPAGTKFIDFDAPADKPRNYRALSVVNGHPTYFAHWHRDAATAFADLMAPWYGGDEEKPRKKKKKIKALDVTP
jgi:hypothetical protein